ncbi:hypothetical protein TNCV_171381 [Trichonephila clavipes]|nr:hypothetical protein TNCV_171381 [Trichonephila clavipes]
MTARTSVDFLHHENPSTCAGVEPATLGTEGQPTTTPRRLYEQATCSEMVSLFSIRQTGCRKPQYDREQPAKFFTAQIAEIIQNNRRVTLREISTATAGSDVVQSGRPIFDDFFQHLWPYIGNNTANVLPNGQAFVAYPHRPMTLHSPQKIV